MTLYLKSSMTDSQRYPLNLCQNKKGGVIPFSVLKLLCSLWFFKKVTCAFIQWKKYFLCQNSTLFQIFLIFAQTKVSRYPCVSVNATHNYVGCPWSEKSTVITRKFWNRKSTFKLKLGLLIVQEAWDTVLLQCKRTHFT